jgi:hypothetical protein
MPKFRLYCGLAREGRFFNHTEVNPLKGGSLAMLNTVDKSPAARLLNLIKGSVDKLYTQEGEEYVLRSEDYTQIAVMDSWKIGYEQIKATTRNQYPIITEFFYCPRCSMPKAERFTEIKESWQQLIDDGILFEIYLDSIDEMQYEVNLPEPIVIQSMKTIAGGSFNKIFRRHPTLGDSLKIHQTPSMMQTEVTIKYGIWDTTIVGIDGMPERDFNVLIRNPSHSFSQKYIADSQENIDAMDDADEEHMIGINARGRTISCQYCGYEIGGELDSSNFFSPLLPKSYIRKG